MNIYVIRHGQVPSNVDGIISGWNDEKLTEKGISQALDIKEKLQHVKFDVIYSSPIIRAKQTAEIIVPENEILYDLRLAERDPGLMLGKPRKNIDKKSWNSLDTDKTLEGVETLGAGLRRVREFLDEIKKINDNKTILIVTHNFISKCIWIIENNIKDTDEINEFFHDNGEIKYYEGK